MKIYEYIGKTKITGVWYDEYMKIYEYIGKTKITGVWYDEYMKIEDENGAVFKIRLQELPKITEIFTKIIKDFGL
jgi:hypothetical protein